MKTLSLVGPFALIAFLLLGCGGQGVVQKKSSLALSTTPTNNTSITNFPAQLDRVGVASYLMARFGGAADTPTKRLVRAAAGDFGGRCDPRGDLDGGFVCEGADAYAPSQSRLGLSRFALVHRACESILGGSNADESVRKAASVVLKTAADQTPPRIDARSLQGAWELFFTDRSLSAPVRDALNLVVTKSRQQSAAANMNDDQQRLDEWRFVLLSLCQLPDWQFLN